MFISSIHNPFHADNFPFKVSHMQIILNFNNPVSSKNNVSSGE